MDVHSLEDVHNRVKWNAIQNNWEYKGHFILRLWGKMLTHLNMCLNKSFQFNFKLFTFKHKHHKQYLHILSWRKALFYLKERKKKTDLMWPIFSFTSSSLPLLFLLKLETSSVTKLQYSCWNHKVCHHKHDMFQWLQAWENLTCGHTKIHHILFNSLRMNWDTASVVGYYIYKSVTSS